MDIQTERLLNSNNQYDHESQGDTRKPQKRWCSGPDPVVAPHVSLFLPKVQKFPRKLFKRVPPIYSKVCYLLCLALWAVVFMELASHSLLGIPNVDGDENIKIISCARERSIWAGRNDACGLNGQDCLGAHENITLRFRCPANCLADSKTYTPTPVGADIVYRHQYVIGGNNKYRADSFICGAAIHHGAITAAKGGCVSVSFDGPHTAGFPSQRKNNFESVGFDSEFVGSFHFEEDPTSKPKCTNCNDQRVYMIIWSLLTVYFLGYFCLSTVIFFFSSVFIGFWTVFLGSNPPFEGGTPYANNELISRGFQRLLPCLLGAFFIYEVAAKPQLSRMPAYLSRAIFYVTSLFLGLLENYVFRFIPIDRIIVTDLNQQKGAWLALFLIVSGVIAIAVGQAYVMWRMGKFTKYLGYYLLLILGLALLAMIPGQTLRIHHYILALLLLPGTGLQTTPSLIYQGLLVGLYIAGVARWDFDSILQTYHQLSRGGPETDQAMMSFIAPSVLPSNVDGIFNYLLQWTPLHLSADSSVSYSGYALFINDVERYRGPLTKFNLTEWALETFVSLPYQFYARVAPANLPVGNIGVTTLAGIANIHTGKWIAPLKGST